MAEEKTYVFGEGAGNNGILSLLGPMLSQRGVDPNVLLAARNCILCSRYLLYRWNSRRIRTNRM